MSPTTPPDKPTVWAVSFSLAATREVAFAFFSYGYLDVSVPHVRSARLCIQRTVIRESWDQCSFDSFPRLIAAFYALHRLLTPRHPPHALICLATMINSQNFFRSATWPTHFLRHLASFSANHAPRKNVYRCHLDFIKLSKITATQSDQAPNCERGSVTAILAAVNSSGKKVLFFLALPISEQCHV